MGALIALIIVLLLNFLVILLAEHSAPAGRAPDDFVLRLDYALRTLQSGLSGLSSTFSSRELLIFLSIALLGAVAGIIWYLFRARVVRLPSRTKSKPGSRKRRRSY